VSKTDRDWERWGASSPYYGVLSIDKFRGEHMTTEAEAEFFESGERHVSSIFSRIEAQHAGPFLPMTTLDFGCGVGRLAIPLASRSERVIAMDISDSMLEETRKNCDKRNIVNVKYVKSDDELSVVVAPVDLVHSFIVLQHIAERRGTKIITRLAESVATGGYLAVQFYTMSNANPLVRTAVKLRYGFPPANWLRNAIKSRPIFEQPMQLHTYNLAKILRILRRVGFSQVEAHLDTEDGGRFESVFVLARKNSGGQASIINPHS